MSRTTEMSPRARVDAMTPDPAREGSPDDPLAKRAERLVSLDAFRGLVILGMLLVNNIALDEATPRQFTHAAWNQGLHFADMILPWFLLIVGVAIPFSAASYGRQGRARWRYYLKALGRTVTLILLGILLDSSIARRPIFGLGVLQLIGAAYLIGALLQGRPPWLRLSLAGALLLGHWAALHFVEVPGVGAGVFTEEQNLITYLNQEYLGRYGLRGLISVAPASALALLGTVAGDLLRSEYHPPARKAISLLAGGLGLAALGWLWNLETPFSKSLWTSSYVLFAAGCGLFALGLFYLLLDLRGWRAWAFPLVVPGVNAIFAYVIPILVKVHILQEWTLAAPGGSSLSLQQTFLNLCIRHMGRIGGGWLYTLSYIACWWIVLWGMYRAKIRWRV